MAAFAEMPAVFEEEDLIAVGSVNLTEEEHAECESFLRSVIQRGDCEKLLRGKMAASFKRGIISACLMGRARRFLHHAASSSVTESSPADFNHPDLYSNEPDWAEMAYEAAAKACDIFPVSINFYDFGCLLQEQGRHGKARIAFKEFLRRASVKEIDAVARAAVSRRNLAGAIEHARQSL